MGWKMAIIIFGLALLAMQLWFILLKLQPFKVVYNHAPGECHSVNPIVNGSEDIQMVDDGKVLFTSGLKLGNPDKHSNPGHIYLFDFNKPEEGALPMRCSNLPSYGTTRFNPHGLGLHTHRGQIFAYVVNHATEDLDTVEKFIIDLKQKSLTHVKTFTSELFRSLNDILVTDADVFYVTHMSYFRSGLARLLELAPVSVPWASVVLCKQGACSLAIDRLIMANGIQMSADRRYVYVNEGGRQSVHVFLLNESGALSLVQTKKLEGIVCDNLDIEEGTGHLWLGCHSALFRTIQLVDTPGNGQQKLAPSVVLRIKTRDGLLSDDVTEVYHNDGRELSASSVAVYHAGTSSVLIGSIDSKLLHCKVNYLP